MTESGVHVRGKIWDCGQRSRSWMIASMWLLVSFFDGGSRGCDTA